MISLNPQTISGPPPGADPIFGAGTDAFFSLMRLVSDPDAAKERLGKIYDAVMAANEQIAAAKAAQEELAAARKAHDNQLHKERAEHDRSLAAARAKSDADCGAAMADVRSKQERASKAAAQAEADATAAANLKADLEQRLAKIRSAAA
jgi:polyribonucleotide nucleotidyltransferase